MAAIFVKNSGGESHMIPTSVASHNSGTNGNYTINFTATDPGVYMLIAAGVCTNSGYYINTPTVSGGSLDASFNVLDSQQANANGLTKAFVFTLGAGDSFSCAIRFSGYATRAYRVLKIG